MFFYIIYRISFLNESHPFLRGNFEETYKIDDSGRHVTIDGKWNPYSSIYPYNFEKVDAGFNFYKNTTDVWFHVPVTALQTAFRTGKFT